MMKINFYLIFAAICIDTSYIMQATQAPLVQPQRKATPLELKMINQARFGRLTQERLEAYLTQGADINAKDVNGQTALMLAISTSNMAVVPQLIAAGVDINAKDNSGYTALIYAMLTGNTAVIPQLIAAGVDVNAKDNAGETALMLAAWTGHTAVIQQLIAAGADDTIRNAIDRTARVQAKDQAAYDKAVAAGNKERADYLARQAQAQRMLEEHEQLIPGVSDIIRDYAFSRSPQDLPKINEKKRQIADDTSSALHSKK